MVNGSGRIFRGTDEAEAARRAYEASLPLPHRREPVEADWLRELCLQAGADDVGFVDIGRAGLGAENDNARRHRRAAPCRAAAAPAPAARPGPRRTPICE